MGLLADVRSLISLPGAITHAPDDVERSGGGVISKIFRGTLLKS